MSNTASSGPSSPAPTTSGSPPATAPTGPAEERRVIKVKDVRPGNKRPCSGHVVERVIIEANTVTIVTDRGEERHDMAGDPAIEVIS